MDMIILAGGMGKRLRPLTQGIPKAMVPVNGKPLLQHHLEWLRNYPAVDRIIVSCGYKWEEIKRHFGTRFIYAVEDEPLGTGGAIKRTLELIEGDEFFVLNSDDISDVDLNQLKVMGTDTITVSKFHCRFGIVDVQGDAVTGFQQKPLLPYWASMGLYFLSTNVLPLLPDKGSIEIDTFPRMKLKAYKHEGFWMTVNTIKDLEELEKALKEKRTIKPEA